MIIIRPYETKFLMPVKKTEWQTPSAAQPKDQFGNENQTRFRVRARLSDGHIIWCGWFEDRNDFDAFLLAIARGTLGQEPALWRLPVPNWIPDMGSHVSYDFFGVTFLTAPTGSLQSYSSPSDWRDINNTIELIAGGASGGNRNGTGSVAGGGGGEYGWTKNFVFLTPGVSTASYQIGIAGAGKTGGGTGNVGGATWFDGTTQAGATLGALGGNPGTSGVTGTGLSGGLGGSGGVGTFHYAGGRGGNVTSGQGSSAGTGGGGAGGPFGAGVQGVDGTGIKNGGAGGGGYGGAGGVYVSGSGAAGGAGTEFDSTHGSGGGGSAGGATSGTGGSGGNYGAGGGGGFGTSSTSGAGKQGIIVITYNPNTVNFNMPMLGM